MEDSQRRVYHEKQRLQFCLLHALNNLFQEKDAFTRDDLDSVSERLDREDPHKQGWTPFSLIFKPHHNILTGNYDVNVLIAALEKKGKTVVWHDKRNRASSIDLDGTEEEMMGIVLNVPVKKYGGLWNGRHWVALRKIEGVWYNLDSDFATPKSFDNTMVVWEFLDDSLSAGAEIFLVMNEGQ